MSGLDFAALRNANARRCARWHKPGTEPWTGADWSNAMCGEAGEAANVVKKLRRHETHTGSADNPPIEALKAKLGEELADTVIYADLVAVHYGIDLAAAIVAKFNLVSEREGFPERLPTAPAALAERERQAAERAWDEGCGSARAGYGLADNPYRADATEQAP